jgi:hypothetical protein
MCTLIADLDGYSSAKEVNLLRAIEQECARGLSQRPVKHDTTTSEVLYLMRVLGYIDDCIRRMNDNERETTFLWGRKLAAKSSIL